MNYYRIEESLDNDQTWVVGIDDEHAMWLWRLRCGMDIVAEDGTIPIRVDDGLPTPFSLGFFQIPVVSRVLAGQIEALAPDDVQIIPAKLSNGADDYVALNTRHSLDCLVPEIAARWELSMQSLSPVRRTRIAGHKMFRMVGSPAIVVSDDIRLAILLAGSDNICFEAVCFTDE